MSDLTLYGSPVSLYTGRPRSYFIKAGIAYREVPANSQHFFTKVLPKAGNHYSMPTIEFPDGAVIRDGVAIVDHFEAQSGYTFTPSTPKQKIVCLLLDVIGAEGLLRPAMHYRWSFPENLEYMRFHMQEGIVPPGEHKKRMAQQAIEKMQNGAVLCGATPEAIPAIEKLYNGLLVKLNEHFSEYPYFLGDQPCIGDFGMLGPLYGHLGRDPVPLALMQKNALRLWRWVERMNRPEPDTGEFPGSKADGGFLKDDNVPVSLIKVLKHLAIDFVPETEAAAACINDWLAENTDVPAGTQCERAVGNGRFDLQGTDIEAWAQPFRFYLLERVQTAFKKLDLDSQASVLTMLEAMDMAPLLDISLDRQIGRKDNLEVWL